MGLQFIDIDGTERTLTEADMLLPEFQESYSDLFKSLNDFRPRGEYFWSPDVMLRFFATYDREIEARLERDRLEDEYRLEELRHEHGIQFANLAEARQYDELKEIERWEAEQAEIEVRKAHKVEMMRRGSPLPFIEDWDYGMAA